MRRIEEDNNRMMDNRIAREATYNKKITEEKRKIAEAEKSNHTNDINSTDHLLCNIVLGEGVAEDFKGDSRYDEKLEHYCEEYQCQAPWFCVYPFTQVDQELSKRIFVAKCGHMFCGRCVKNIGNRPRRKSKDTKMSVLNPNISSPSTCPEPDCGKKFTAKSFTEVYY
ncbi:LOW QUALITY PROTEIN: SLX5 E3 ubiquitin-protein ligase complex SLX5-SLX8 subunit SLX5 [Candida maltosa Xu316]